MFEGLFPLANPVWSFAALLIVILVVPRIAEVFRLPGVVALIIAGMALGPFGFNIMVRGETVQLMAQVGIIFIMFLAGLEIDLHQLFRRKGQTLIYGLLTFAIPLATGIWGGLSFGMALMPAILLASMLSSHTLLTYPMASKLGLNKDDSVTITLGGTVITNLLAMLILAVIAAWWGGNPSPAYWFKLGLGMAAYTLALFIILPLVARWGLRLLSEEPDIQFLLIFTLMFVSAAAATPAGLEPVIGAFIAGLILNPYIPDRSVLMNRVQFLGNGLFIPLFLVDVGFLVDLRTILTNPGAWAISAFMVIAAILTKLIPAVISGLTARLKPAQVFLMYGLSVNQAAGTLAAVLVGRRIGIFDDTVVTATIAMILVTCFIGPLITDASGRHLARKRREHWPGDSLIPGRRVLVSLGDPGNHRNLMELGNYLSARDGESVLIPAIVVADDAQVDSHLVHAENQLQGATEVLGPLGLSIDPVTSLDTDVGHGLMRVARSKRADTVILGWNGDFSLSRSLLGSTFDKVVEVSPQRLMVVKGRPGWTNIKRMLVLVPAYTESHGDIGSSLRLLSRLARQLTLAVVFHGPAATVGALAQIWAAAKLGPTPELEAIPGREATADSHTNWLPEPRAQDLLVHVASRPHQAVWTPAESQRPRLLTQTFPAHPLIILYPALSEEGPDPESGAENPLGAAAQVSVPDHITLRTLSAGKGTSRSNAMVAILERDMSPRAARRLARSILADKTRQTPVPGSPHILFHYRTKEVQGFWLGIIQEESAVLSVLLTPLAESHAQHLQTLAWVCGRIRAGEPPYQHQGT